MKESQARERTASSTSSIASNGSTTSNNSSNTTTNSSSNSSSSNTTTTTTTTTTTNNNNNNKKQSAGIQLLSPTLQQSIEARSTTVNPLAAPRVGANNNNMASFDFDNFTLESVHQKTTGSTNPSKNRAYQSSQAQKLAAELDADPQAIRDTSSYHPMRSTEVFGAERRRKQPSVSSGYSKHVSGNGPMPNATAGVTAVGTRRKKAAVTMRGWLQRRKGLVIKRWKAHYCLLKDDDNLCLYASEDTVNGKLDHRFQVLRILLTEKSDSFHIIGVGSDGTPRKEEFRALHSVDWRNWFCAFREFFDAVSLDGALARKPELSLSSPTISRGSEEEDYGDYEGDSMSLSSSTHQHRQHRQHRQHHQQHQHHQRAYSTHSSSHGGERQSTSVNKRNAMRESYDSYSDEHFGSRSTMSGFSVASSNNQSAEDDSGGVDLRQVVDKIDVSTMPESPTIHEDGGGDSATQSCVDVQNVKPAEFSW